RTRCGAARAGRPRLRRPAPRAVSLAPGDRLHPAVVLGHPEHAFRGRAVGLELRHRDRPAGHAVREGDPQWARYGGRAPALLQFTNAATVPGVSGRVDCSAFRGTAARLRDRLLPNASRQATEDLMQPGFLLAGEGAITPLAIPNGAKR